MKNKIITVFLLSALILCSGCSKSSEISDKGTDKYITENSEELSYCDIIIDDNSLIFNAFTVIDDNRTTVLAYNDDSGSQNIFAVYENGVLSGQTEISADYHEICSNSEKNCFYTFDAEKKQINIMDENFGFSEILIKCPEAVDIRSMDVVGNKLYYISVPQDIFDADVIADATNWDSDYMNFGEKAYSIDLDTKEVKDLGIENVICQSYSENTLYYYTFRNNHYSLEIYDPESNTLKSVRNMDDVGYIYSFAFLNGEFYYISDDFAYLVKMNLNSGESVNEPGEVFILRNSDFEVYKNRLIYLNRTDSSIRLFGENSSENKSDSELSKYSGENIVLGVFSATNVPVDTAKIKSDSGVSTTVKQLTLTDEELKLKLLSGDSDVDIYVFGTNHRIGRDILSSGCYVPITDSSVIEEHSEFFDSIADYTTDKNGEIWCEPIYADTFAAFYIPENLKAVGADVKDIETFDGFFDVLEKINAQEKYKFYSGSTLDFAYSMEESYNVNYSYLDYNSDTFRNMFERIYSGWIAWSNPLEGKSENPLFYNTASDSEVSDWNSSDAALQLDYVSEFFVSAENPGDWNAAGLPSVSSSEEKTPVTVYYAVINPSGNNKNAAEAYLGYIAENRFNLRTKQTFLYKDRNLYADNFDTTAAYFDELYKLYENSSVYERLLPMNEDFGQDVIQYQLGEITLDDYIAKLERTSEMTANE